jgi:hypothetical protein
MMIMLVHGRVKIDWYAFVNITNYSTVYLADQSFPTYRFDMQVPKKL